VRSKLEDYTFSEQEIRILKEIARENHLLSSIRKSVSIRPSLLSHYLRRLSRKNLIESRKLSLSLEPKAEKSGKYLYFSDSKHALLLKELLLKYDHINWENILSGLGIEVLFQILAEHHVNFKNFSHVTFWRYSKDFMSRGIVDADGDLFHINSRFSLLADFLREYQQFIMSRLVRSLPQPAVVLWQKDFECLIRLSKNLRIDNSEFQKTATSCLQDFGIQLTSDFEVYLYSQRKKTICIEDVLLHTLLIERDNIRYVTYALLLLKKEAKRINKEYLLEEANWFDLGLQVNAMLEFLRTKGVRGGLTLPTWAEFADKARDYGVHV
jgi:hypothetical protein